MTRSWMTLAWGSTFGGIRSKAGRVKISRRSAAGGLKVFARRW